MVKKALIATTFSLMFCVPSWADENWDFWHAATSLYYSYLTDSTVCVVYPNYTSYHNNYYLNHIRPTGDLVIPDSIEYNGHTYIVTAIGEHALSNCIGLTSISLPNTLESIGEYAFEGCGNIGTIRLPNNTLKLGQHIFYGCKLDTLIVPERVWCETDIYPFERAQNYSRYLESHYTEINYFYCNSQSALNGLTTGHSVNINSLFIGENITYIHSCEYERTFNLNYLYIGSNVSQIGARAFSREYYLDSVRIMAEAAPYIATYSVTTNGVGPNCRFLPVPLMNVKVPCGSLESYIREWCEGTDANGNNNRVYYTGSSTYYYALDAALSYYKIREPEVPGITVELDVDENSIGRGGAFVFPAPYYWKGLTSEEMPHPVRCTDSSFYAWGGAEFGYHFDHWSNGETNNPLHVFTVGDTALTAYFSPNQYTVQTFNSDLGRVEQQGYSAVSSSDDESTTANYTYLDTVTLRAIPIPHHHLVHWTVIYHDDYGEWRRDTVCTGNPQRLPVDGFTEVHPYFAIDTYDVQVATSNISRGYVEASGTTFVYNTPCTVTAIPYTGYTFVGWSNGVTANPYIFPVTENTDLTALFSDGSENIYTVTVHTSDASMGSVHGGGIAFEGGTLAIRAEANYGYRFVRWDDNDTHSVRNVVVNGDASYTAYFSSENTGVEWVQEGTVVIYAENGRIMVNLAATQWQPKDVKIFDILGRPIGTIDESGRTPILQTGIYLVKVGTLPTRKVMINRKS